jgi:histidine kinase/DNA gyrase B/HSP90-like ATPase
VLSVEYEAKRVVLTVEDEGRGFDPAQLTRGFGLRGMEKRARSIAAHLSVTSQTGKGTRVQVTAPLEEHMSARGLFGMLRGGLRMRLSRLRSRGRTGWAGDTAVQRSHSRIS